MQGATEIAKSAVLDPEVENIMNEADRSKMLANLLVVLVSDKDATPVVPL